MSSWERRSKSPWRTIEQNLAQSYSTNVEIVPEKIDTVLGVMTPVHTPGHSDDHTVYFIKDAGVIFSGDLYLADKIKIFRSDENIGVQIESLKKILMLDFDVLLCCHSPKYKEGKKHINRKLDFLEDFYGNIIFLYQRGLSEKQIFRSLHLKEDRFKKFFCFGDVSMINGVRSAIRYYNKKTELKRFSSSDTNVRPTHLDYS